MKTIDKAGAVLMLLTTILIRLGVAWRLFTG